MRSFEFHRITDAAARRAAFAASEPKMWWERHVLPTLVITDAEVAADVLRRTDFVVPDMPRLVKEIKQRHSVSLSCLQQTLECLPLYLEGEHHLRIRKLLGPFLSAALREIEPHLPMVVDRLVGGLPREGRIDLLSALLLPLIRDVFSRLAGRELTDEIAELTLIRIFEATHSITSLKNLNQMLERVFKFLDADNREQDDFICRLCCLVFGYDNVLSTLAENLAAAFQQSAGAVPAQLAAYPVEVMISATYRQPLAATEIAGHVVQPDNLVRIHLEPFGYSPDKSLNAALFGVGRHGCVGKQLSLSVWKHLSERFNAAQICGTITDYACLCTHSFNFVRKLEVSIRQ